MMVQFMTKCEDMNQEFIFKESDLFILITTNPSHHDKIYLNSTIQKYTPSFMNIFPKKTSLRSFFKISLAALSVFLLVGHLGLLFLLLE
jgi:hypothetical protein